MTTSMVCSRMNSATAVGTSVKYASTVGLALLTLLTADEKSVIASNGVEGDSRMNLLQLFELVLDTLDERHLLLWRCSCGSNSSAIALRWSYCGRSVDHLDLSFSCRYECSVVARAS